MPKFITQNSVYIVDGNLFYGKESINGSEIEFVTCVNSYQYKLIKVFFVTAPEQIFQSRELVITYLKNNDLINQPVEQDKHLLIILTEKSTREKGRFGLMSSRIVRVEE